MKPKEIAISANHKLSKSVLQKELFTSSVDQDVSYKLYHNCRALMMMYDLPTHSLFFYGFCPSSIV